MNEQIKQIAERLAGLRDALEIAPEEIAKVCNLTTEQYPGTGKRQCRYFSQCFTPDITGIRSGTDHTYVR